MRLLAELGADVKTPNNNGCTPVWIAAQKGDAEVVRALAELGADLMAPSNIGTTPAMVAALNGHAEVLRLLAELGVNVTTADNGPAGLALLLMSSDGAHFAACRTLLLLGAPITIGDLSQRTTASGDARQLRADLQAWAADALTQHRTFHDTFLHGTSAHEGIALAALGGVAEVREQIAEFVGIVVGVELRHLRAVGPAIAAIDWAAHDEQWDGPPEDSDEEGPDDEGEVEEA